MNNSLDHIKQRILDISNPEIPYTQKDFDEEFSYQNNTIKDNPFMIELKYVNKSKNEDPAYATNGSSGFDLRAYLIESVVIKSGSRMVIPTGLYFEIPENFEIQIRSRSGLAAKNGISVLNSPGTIDSDYRGEIKIILINLSDEDLTVNNGDRIAQGIFASVLSKNVVNLTKVNDISLNTERNDGGFGSTGVK